MILNYANGNGAQLNSSGGTLIQAFGHTISGQGTINAALINQGLVNANVNGQTLALATNPMTNALTMEATGGGLLNIDGTIVYNTGSTILASGGTVEISSGGTVVGGTLTVAGASNLTAAGGATLNGVDLSIANGSQFNILGGETVTVSSGTTINNGTIVVDSNSASSATYLTFSGNQTLSGTGSGS